MGLLDKLWDDTVAGPRPDTGLGRLRKQPVRPAAVKINDPAGDAAAFVPPSPVVASEGNHRLMLMRGHPHQGRPAPLLPSKCEHATCSHTFLLVDKHLLHQRCRGGGERTSRGEQE
ncbi:hypothetical protein PVAP13_9NG587600 [Panicum virgatum]|uniref:Uncharacterized protein n=1 Tax=Panicum virgatum TaxID=38727 RepID=A0A8T0MZ20_PANVG|nr:hypothetical protein PVAP13_9NG587600 [Panicum virgatum]